MKFAIFAVVVAVCVSQAFGQYYAAQPFAYQAANLVAGLDPQLLVEAQALAVKSVQRVNEFVDNMPNSQQIGAEASELWALAYPQLKTLLTKAGAWANQIPVPARRKRSPQFFYNQGGNDAFNQIANDVRQYMDPAILTESTDVLLNTIERTNEMIDNLPRMDETARQMSDLWAIAYPQLKTLLSKAGAWANQVA